MPRPATNRVNQSTTAGEAAESARAADLKRHSYQTRVVVVEE